MYTIKNLEERFNWSYMQVRKRVMWLKDSFKEEVKGGKNRKYQVTENGLTILDRIHQLEQDNYDLNSALSKVKKEVVNPDRKGDNPNTKQDKTDLNRSEKRIIQEKDARIKDLKERVSELKEDKKRMEHRIDDLEQKFLTGEVKENETKSLWGHLWEWWGSPYDTRLI